MQISAGETETVTTEEEEEDELETSSSSFKEVKLEYFESFFNAAWLMQPEQEL